MPTLIGGTAQCPPDRRPTSPPLRCAQSPDPGGFVRLRVSAGGPVEPATPRGGSAITGQHRSSRAPTGQSLGHPIPLTVAHSRLKSDSSARPPAPANRDDPRETRLRVPCLGAHHDEVRISLGRRPSRTAVERPRPESTPAGEPGHSPPPCRHPESRPAPLPVPRPRPAIRRHLQRAWVDNGSAAGGHLTHVAAE